MSHREKNKQRPEEPEVEVEHHPPTSYVDTLIHLFKGNIGPGLFAMGDAFKNGGLIASPILTVIIALICVHCQHILLKCSARVRQISSTQGLDYADTVEQCFELGHPKLRNWSSRMRTIVNIFICVTQLGFCCVYFVFISTNMKQIIDYYGFHWNIHTVMALGFLPVLLSSLITNLKYLAPVSLVANICMVYSLAVTMFFGLHEDLDSASERNYFTDASKLALYFGTAIFAFEGIALVLPLKNSMKNPNHFDRSLGVLNIGMTLVTFLFIFAGFFGYLKWGEGVGGSLTLNLDDSPLSQSVKIMVSLGVLLGYPLQFFVAIQIMWPGVQTIFGIKRRQMLGELIFRTILVVVTFIIAELVPALSLFISLIGALCSTALALIFPPMIELIVLSDNSKGPGMWIFLKDIFILFFALVGFSAGSYESISRISVELSL